MKKSTLRATAALQALALLGAGAGAAFIAAPAAAQDYTSGVITGTVTDDSGNPVSGATVTLTSKAQGFTRTSTSSGNGQFRFTGLPSGDYNVSVESANSAGFQATDVRVLAGQTADLNVQLAAAGGEDIVVTGAQIVAFEGNTTGLNVDVEELKKTVPIGRNLTSVILLAPGTTGGDSAFGNLASVGGSSVAENAYYVNGLNTTNFDNYLGSAQVPFDMYKSVEVKSGGYPAEFGRATGGIVNAVTKSGSNDFMAAVHLNWTPNFLRGHSPDTLNCQNIRDSSGVVQDVRCIELTNRHFDYSKGYSAVVEAGGPIFRDRLFVYGLAEFRKTDTRTVNATAGTAFRSVNDDPFWGFKVDAYPLDDHHLEFTMFSTRNTTTRFDQVYSEDAGGTPSFGIANSVTDFNAGGTNYVGKYTGRFTDWLTLSAAYGRMRDRFDNIGVAGSAGQALSQNGAGQTINGVPNGGFFNGQRVASTQSPYLPERRFFRADADVYVNLLGDHHFRGGFDVEKNTLSEASVRNGNPVLCSTGRLTAAACNAGLGGAGAAFILRAPVTTGANIQPLAIEVNYFNSYGAFKAKNTAYYLQDEWKATDRLTISAGVRRDDFSVQKGDGTPLVNLDKNYAPRIGVTYDLWNDKRGTVKAFYGQYYLPFASNTAFRMTGNELFFRERFAFTGAFDANGIPILGAQITNRPDYQSTCPFALTPSSSGFNCSVTGDGSVADSTALIAHNLKATKEQEWMVGYDHKFGRWNVGVNFTRRKLLTTAEDVAIDAAVLAYCEAEGITGCSSTWTGFHQYVVVNPGEDIIVNLDGLDGREVTLTAEQLGYPKAKRTYSALEFTFDRPYDGVWTVGGSYTWSKSKGNSEGFVQSDFGQDDAGITQDFDQPGFTEYAYGYLPNDRRHRFKLWGSYTFDDKLTIGSNISVDSPRSLSCFGFHPTDVFAQVYGAASHYCGGEPAPRGEGEKSDWVANVDLKAAYKVTIPTGQALTFRADVFNVFNSSAVQERYELGDLDLNTPDPNYGQPRVYQSPRSVRLGLDIEF